MTDTQAVLTNAKKGAGDSPPLASWNAFRRIRMVKEENPNLNKIELRELLRAELMEEFARDIFNTWFDQIYDHMFGRTERRQSNAAQREKLLASGREQLATVIREAASIEFLKWMMPNGKLLADCTGTEIKRLGNTAGPFLAHLARRLGPRQKVRSVFNEAQLKALYETSGLNATR